MISPDDDPPTTSAPYLIVDWRDPRPPVQGGDAPAANVLAKLGGESGLARLLEEAGRRGIDVAQDSKLRLATLLARYAEAGLSFSGGEEAGVVVAGVLARTSGDEMALRQMVRDAWDRPATPPAVVTTPPPEDPAVARARRAARNASWRRAALLAAAAVAATGAAALAWRLLPAMSAGGATTAGASEPLALAPDATIADLLLRLMALLPFLLAAWIVWERRPTDAAPGIAEAAGGIPRWLPGAGELPLFASLAARRSLERLRRPLRIRSRRIDVGRSLRATARAGGVPRLHFEERRVAIECVVLVERAGRTDHVAALGVRLARRLREAGAQVARYEFSGSPSFVARIEENSGTRGAPVAFDRFTAAHARARLLLVSSGDAFLDPRSLALVKSHAQALDAFAQVYLLSPAPRRHAEGRMRLGGMGEAAFRAAMAERAFGEAGARVVAADEDGIAAVAASALAISGEDGDPASRAPDLPDRLLAQLDAHPPLYLAEHTLDPAPDNGADAPLATRELSETEVSELVAALRAHMGTRAAFRLLAAVLIYPRLHPDLTAAIARALSAPAPVGRGGALEPAGPELTTDLYLRIARLPWSRGTKAPAWLRLALARALTDAERAAVAGALDKVTTQLAPDPAPRDPERVLLTPDDGTRIGHPSGVPAADPVFAAFRDADDPLHIAILAPRLAEGRTRAPASPARRWAIGALLAAGAGAYLYAQALVAVLAAPGEVLRGWAASFFGAIVAWMPSVFGSQIDATICSFVAILLSVLWLLFPFRIALPARTYREPDMEAVGRVAGAFAADGRARAREWLADAATRLRGNARPEAK